MSGTFTNILLHVVFSTKSRAAFIGPDIRDRLYDYLGGIVRRENGVLYAIGGMPDHVHLLVRWRADISVSDFLRDLKSYSSKWVHKEFPGLQAFGWQDGYGAFSVSRSKLAEVEDYILGQAEHHAARDFKSELLALLKAHEIEYDEAHIWR